MHFIPIGKAAFNPDLVVIFSPPADGDSILTDNGDNLLTDSGDNLLEG